MPAAIPKPVREELVRRHTSGESLADIARNLAMSYRTVCNLWQRYRRKGRLSLEANYRNCGRSGPRFDPTLHQAVLEMRRTHGRWGAGLIRVELAGLYPNQRLPDSRTIARWLCSAGLQQIRAHKPRVARSNRGRVAHEVWEIDAKEMVRLGNGQLCCQLSVSDEASGAPLGARAFPPRALGAGSAQRVSGGAASVVPTLGAARASSPG